MGDGFVVDNPLDFVELVVCSSNNDDCLKRFIKTYESLPELWNKGDPNYNNKYKKRVALGKLLMIYREIKPQAIIKDVSKKLNTLRSNYRRELNKIKNSIQNGCGRDEEYKPTSWVFYALKFLGDSEIIYPIVEPEESQEQEESASSLLQQTSSLSTITSYQPPAKKKKVQDPTAKKNELLQEACDFLLNKSNHFQEDEYLNIAKVWAYKLKNLEPIQRKLTEKIINDIFFKAEMKTLLNHSVELKKNRNSSPILSGSSPSTLTLNSQSPIMHESAESTADCSTKFCNE